MPSTEFDMSLNEKLWGNVFFWKANVQNLIYSKFVDDYMEKLKGTNGHKTFHMHIISETLLNTFKNKVCLFGLLNVCNCSFSRRLLLVVAFLLTVERNAIALFVIFFWFDSNTQIDKFRNK